jgi:PKD repeat protein
MPNFKIQIFFAALFFSSILRAQVWVDDMNNPNLSLYEIQESFEEYWKNRVVEKGKGFKAFKRWENYMEPRVYPSGDITLPSQTYGNYNDWKSQNLNSVIPNTINGNWTIVGPVGKPSGGGAGRLNFIRFDPNDSNIMYVGAPDGGLWKSVNGGVSWSTNTDDLAVIGVSDIAIDPSNSQIMYLATGDNDAGDTYSIGVLKSIDGGTTWNPSGLVFPVESARRISKILINPNNTQIIMAFASNGIWRTTDGGVNWTQPTGTFNSIKDAEFKPGDPSVIYAASTVFKKSTDGGLNWVTINTGLTGVRRLAIAVTPANPEYVYVLAANSTDSGFLGLLRSINSASSFSTRMSSTATNNILGWDDGTDEGGQGWYDLALAASPTNDEEIITGGVNQWKSQDGGTTFSLISHWSGGYGKPYVHADVHDIIYFPGSGATCFSANDGGIFKSIDNGVSWTDISSNLSIAQQYRFSLSSTNSTMVLAGHQDNGTNRTVNGTSWTQVNGGDGMDCFIDRTNNNFQIASIYYGNYFRTTSGSTNFSNIDDPAVEGDWVSPIHQDPVAQAVVYAGGRPALYKTSNIAASTVTWTELATPNPAANTIKEFALAPSNNQVIYVVKSGSGGISRSVDGGVTFTSCTNPTTAVSPTWVAVSNTNPDVAFVVYSGYTAGDKVFKTNDGGLSWINLSSGLPNIPVNCIVYHNGTLNGDAVYIGTDVGVYYRDNSLSSWVDFTSGLPNCAVRDLEIFYPNNKLRCATYGRGTWESDLYISVPVAPVASFISDKTSICQGQSVQFTSTSTGTPSTYSWTFPGGMPATSSEQNPIISYNSAGTYTVTLNVANLNGDDSEIQTTFITVLAPQNLPLIEGFTGIAFPPLGWSILNTDQGSTWTRNSTVGLAPSSGNSMIFLNYSENDIGNQDEFRSPILSFTNLLSAQISFDVAYAAYNASYIDGLEVLLSSDCGITWNSLYLKTGLTVGPGNLPTAPPTTSNFTPTSAQWRNETINLDQYIGEPGVRITFRNLPAYGNNLYIDNINISGVFIPPPVANFSSSTPLICQGETVQFTSTTLGSPTSYSWSFPGGVPSTSTIANPIVSYTSAGSYAASLIATNSSGSDTIEFSNYINVTANAVNTTAVSACDSYEWNGITYLSSGIYSGTTVNCVSESLNLTITPSSTNTTEVSACDSYQWNGTTYSSSGIYSGTTVNCVSESLNLTITPSSINTTAVSACDSYQWNGTTYSSSGIYSGTPVNCVSESLNLTITPSSTNTTEVSACDSYNWNGTTYSSSGIYSGTTVNCVTESLNLTITTSSTNTTTITSLDSFMWDANGVSYTQTGLYTGPIDSCVTQYLNLTINSSGISEEELALFSIYPNPVVTILYIDFSDQKQRAYLIFDNFGSIVKKGFLEKKSEEISVFELSSGFYYFHLEGTKPRKFSKIN